MLCPKCNGKTGVTDISHFEKTNEDYRRRVCKECGNVFYTVEFEIEYDKKLEAQWKANHRDRKKYIKKGKNNEH